MLLYSIWKYMKYFCIPFHKWKRNEEWARKSLFCNRHWINCKLRISWESKAAHMTKKLEIICLYLKEWDSSYVVDRIMTPDMFSIDHRKPWVCHLTWQRVFADMITVKDFEIGRLPGLFMWTLSTHMNP